MDDQDAQHPIISLFGEDVWKTKEAGQKTDKGVYRGVMLKATEAITMMVAGADILCMRHPEAMKIAKGFLNGFGQVR